MSSTTVGKASGASSLGVEQLHTLFNNKLVEFTEDLAPLVSRIPAFAMFKTGIEMLACMQPRQNQDVFERFVVARYGRHIRDRDESFFLHNSYDEFSASGSMDIVSLLKQCWGDFSPSDKDAVWAHLEILISISDAISQKRAA